MMRGPPQSTCIDTLLPYETLFRYEAPVPYQAPGEVGMRRDESAVLRMCCGAQGGDHAGVQPRGRRRSLRQPGVESRRSNPGRMLEHAAEARNEGVAIPDGATAPPSRAPGLCLSCQWRALSMRRPGHTPSCVLT